MHICTPPFQLLSFNQPYLNNLVHAKTYNYCLSCYFSYIVQNFVNSFYSLILLLVVITFINVIELYIVIMIEMFVPKEYHSRLT